MVIFAKPILSYTLGSTGPVLNAILYVAENGCKWRALCFVLSPDVGDIAYVGHASLNRVAPRPSSGASDLLQGVQPKRGPRGGAATAGMRASSSRPASHSLNGLA